LRRAEAVAMGKVSPDSEILEYAISREVEAYYFFLALAERVKRPEMRKIFEDLAKEELEHKAKLELEMMKTGQTVPVVQKPAQPETFEDIFGGATELDIDYKGMLELGMEKEEASFRTYVNLLPNVADQQSREVLLALAEEEVKHKLRFENEYDALLKKG
jgi:rubrerythrin